MSSLSKKKEFIISKYWLVFFFSLIIFSAGIFLGDYFSSLKLNKISSLQDNLKSETLDIELQYSLAVDEPCEYTHVKELNKLLYDIASKLDFMESVVGPEDERVINTKKYYSLLEIKQFLFQKRLLKECGLNRVIFLFFYSNKGDCNLCKDEGFILSYLRKKYDNIMVYSFDVNIPSLAVNTLKDRYNITATPGVVILNATDYLSFNNYLSLSDLETLTNNFFRKNNLLLNQTINNSLIIRDNNSLEYNSSLHNNSFFDNSKK